MRAPGHGSRRLLAAGVFAGAAFVSDACALLVGDVDGDAHLGADSGAHDASVPDHAAEGHATASDAREAGHDGPVDGIADATRDGGHAEAAAEAAPREAATQDARDASEDARDGGFCANLPRTDASSFFCDDFDEVTDASIVGPATLSNGGTFAVRSGASSSPPNALLFAGNPADADVNVSAYLVRQLPAGATAFTLQFDFMIVLDATPGDVTAVGVGGFKGAKTSLVTLELNNQAGSKPLAHIQVEFPSDGGVGESQAVHASNDQFVASSWTRVVVQVGRVGGKYVETSSVGGSVLDDASVLEPSFNADNGQGSVNIGLTLLNQGGPRQLYIDNLVVTTP